jgi:cell division protein FtsB
MNEFHGGSAAAAAKKPRTRKQAEADTPSWVTRNARWVLLLALAFLGVHDIFGAHGFIAMRRTAQEIQAARDEITKLDDENRALTDQVTALKSDPRMIERIAREEMGLARPGEVIFKVPPPPATSDSNSASDKPQQ